MDKEQGKQKTKTITEEIHIFGPVYQEVKIHTYVFSWRTKLEKLLCLKFLGRILLANSKGSHTTKLCPPAAHEIMESKAGSSTISYVFERNGGTEDPSRHSIGCGTPENLS